MAVNTTHHDLASLDFGVVAIGASATLQVVFTNQSSPTASQDIALGGLAVPYTFGAGDDAFTLAADAATHTVDITYTPTAVGTHTDDVTGSTTATDGFTPGLPISLTGRGFSPSYALADIDNQPAGTMKMTLIVDPSLPELTVPDTCKVLHIGTLTELIDIEPGVVDVQNLEIELAEDYSTYAMGFWYKVIQGYPTVPVQFKFILEEDGVDTFYFWGKVYREEVEWSEHYINTVGTEVIRTVTLRLVSLVHALKDAAIDGAITEMLTHDVAAQWTPPGGLIGPYTSTVITLENVLASIASVAFDQSFSTAAIQVRSSDFVFQFSGESDLAPKDAYIVTKSFYALSAFSLNNELGYINGESSQTDNPHLWATQFSNCYDLLAAIAANFGWVVRYYYGLTDGTYDAATPSNNLHRLEFLTRGTTFATLITPEKGVKSSTLLSDSVVKESNIRVSDVHTTNVILTGGAANYRDQTTGEAFSIRDAEVSAASPQGPSGAFTYEFVTNPAPLHAEFDFEVSLQFIRSYATTDDIVGLCDYRTLWSEKSGTPGDYIYMDTTKFWDYLTGAWSAAEESMETAVMKYYNRRFTSGRKLYERTYGSLKFTESGVTSHMIIRPFKRIEINDLITTVTYYATEIRKDFESNTTTVLWIQE